MQMRKEGLSNNLVGQLLNLNMDKKKVLYSVPTNPPRIVGKKITKTRQGHSKIFKNLSEFPIEVNLEGKQNQSIGSINRPHSSITQEHPHKNLRIQSALSNYAEPNKKRLSLDSTNKKYERDSLMSRNSMSKKASKHQIIIDDTTKLKLAQDRRRYNSSCGSAIDEKKTDKIKKLSQKPKRLSINNLHFVKRQSEKSQNNRNKEEKSLIIRDKTDKSKSKSKNKKKRKQSVTQLDKSKASTTAIGFNKPQKTDKKFLKKKQSLSTAVINLPPKEKKKKPKKTSEKVELIDQNSQSEYPINKYEVQVGSKKMANRLSLKPKSKSRKGSASKDKHKKTYSLMQEIDYTSCINIPSNSSGLINSLSHSSHQSSKIKIIDNWEFRYFAEENPTSVNLDQIRYFEQNVTTKKQREAQFINKNFNDVTHYRKRKEIQMEICEDYPNFNQLQLKFLASVMFIQRKWRQHRLYREIFNNFGNSDNDMVPSFIQKSNSKQLNISNGPKSAQKPIGRHNQIQSTQAANFADTTPFSISNQKEQDNVRQKSTQLKQQLYGSMKETRLNNDAYLQPKQSYSRDRLFFQDNAREMPMQYLLDQQRKSSSSKQFSLKSHRYQFLQSDIFPNITYIILKKEQLKEELHKKLYQITQLHHNEAILYDQYLKLKSQYQREYERKLKELSKSKQDIKKGYLKFIDTYKDIKHEALRKVSSESGLMASMYKKVFNFDQQHITTPSSSSESLKMLAKKMLIRKEFFLTQKIEPFIYNASGVNQNNLSERLHEGAKQEPLDLSARCFRSRREKARQEEQIYRKKEMFIDIQSLSNERMDNKRIREGYVISPHFDHQANSKNMTLSFSKSDQLLPLTIKSPKNEDKAIYQSMPQNYERKERLILQEIIASLTHELYTQLVSIDDKRQNIMEFSPQDKVRYTHIHDLQMIEESKSAEESREEKSDELEIVEEEKFREIYKIEGLQEKNNQLSQRRHRNSKEHNISPAASEKFAFDCDDIVHYAQSFALFLKTNNLIDEIATKLNKNQGFTPLQYLKFLRDFQIPDDEYDPLISNQTFIDWEDFFANKYYPTKQQQSEEVFITRQSITIFHRCIFQSIIFLLQEYRPCGQKGIPFPWQKVIYFPRTITKGNLDHIFKKCLSKMQDTLKIKCGIIDEKYIVYNEEDLQRIHEENEDKIINMLEKELGESAHNWYEVEQHCLEIKLELECEIMEYLMLEALDEILESY